MARPRTLPDSAVLGSVRQLLAAGGDKAVSFGTVGRATGLAPSTLAQRYGSVAAMRAAAMQDGWQVLSEATAATIDAAAGKGPQGLLKALDAVAGEAGLLLAGSTGEAARARAADWRRMVETALALRRGSGEKAREGAAILFAAWQGQALWGGDGFRLKDAAKRLG
ncbi:transcriptional regulator [Rhodobacter sp. SGA-6-6]|uniref:transcriptional regulator n=1 Tax=Rhodobacter sp. SGA-6-6 TaxID=2710882 RepID=UPI0013EC029A|nr:transcriptional regulator [Rhodobacter sp. SGA-6-6]NGM45710.1 transcriptional regulator [Rhodobacter sp. SGA-6-6]